MITTHRAIFVSTRFWIIPSTPPTYLFRNQTNVKGSIYICIINIFICWDISQLAQNYSVPLCQHNFPPFRLLLFLVLCDS